MPRYNEGRKFFGILYLHNICYPRVGGSLQRNMTMFKKLCGPDPLKNVVVVTTFWDKIGLVQGVALETELKTKDRFLKGLVEGGSKFVRFGKFPPEEIPKGPEFLPPISIVSELVALDPVFLEMQKELAEGKTVEETSAGAYLQQQRDAFDLHQKIDMILAQMKGRSTREAVEDENKALKGQNTQPQVGLLNESRFNNINGGNFHNTGRDTIIFNVIASSSKCEFPTKVIVLMFTRYLTIELADLYKLVATSALHDSMERFPQPKRYASTRKRILQRILKSAESDSEEGI